MEGSIFSLFAIRLCCSKPRVIFQRKKKGSQVSPLFLYSTNPTCSCLILFFSFLKKKKKKCSMVEKQST